MFYLHIFLCFLNLQLENDSCVLLVSIVTYNTYVEINFFQVFNPRIYPKVIRSFSTAAESTQGINFGWYIYILIN